MIYNNNPYGGGRLPIGSRVTFTCLPGFNLMGGPNKVSCRWITNAAEWSAVLPKCLTEREVRDVCAEEDKDAVLVFGKWVCGYSEFVFILFSGNSNT